jgi:S-adenosylmethionine decarboxylase
METSFQPTTSAVDVEHAASGSHFLLKLSGCAAEKLNSEVELKELAFKAAVATGATVLDVISRQFEPQGITVLVMLAESHASLHTYPEWGVVFWDCFTCGQTCKPELSAQVLEESLTPTNSDKQIIIRQ